MVYLHSKDHGVSIACWLGSGSFLLTSLVKPGCAILS
jgi:hypothetical protein